MPEMTLQEKRLSLGTHHFKLLLLQWLWEHLFLKGLCLRCTNNNVLIFTFIQRLDILVLPTTNHSPFQQKATDQEKRKEKTNPSTPKPLNLPCQVQRWASLTLICVIKAAVRLWSSLSQQPQTHHELAGPPFPFAHRPAQFPALPGSNWAQPVTAKELWKTFKKLKKSSCFLGTVWFGAHLAIARRFHQISNKTKIFETVPKSMLEKLNSSFSNNFTLMAMEVATEVNYPTAQSQLSLAPWSLQLRFIV